MTVGMKGEEKIVVLIRTAVVFTNLREVQQVVNQVK
jgi:hypothetical protein